MSAVLTVIFLAVLGACIGSFLNVVIYRLPRDESLVSPASHCPACGRPIPWYDNIPVVSYVLLRGRCRWCRGVISPRYMLVEISTALIFVAVYDALYSPEMGAGFPELAGHWPRFVSYLCLGAGLIACSALDIEYYLIDLRIVYFIIVAGLVGWGLGGSDGQAESWPVFGPVWLLVSVGAILGDGIRRVLACVCSRSTGGESDSSEAQDEDGVGTGADDAGAVATWQRVLLLVFAALGISLMVWTAAVGADRMGFLYRAWAYVGWFFLAILIGLIPHRASDQHIVAAIEEERSGARRQALRELAGLMPACVGMVLAVGLFSSVSPVRAIVQGAYEARIGSVQPFAGLTAALAGLVIAAGFGWAVRIIFTLAFGKEAMGVGDIYILAAVGTVAGPLVAIVGFFIGSIIGVLGVVMLLLWKASRALSYGPWISMGVFVCVLFYDGLVQVLRPAAIGVIDLIQGR